MVSPAAGLGFGVRTNASTALWVLEWVMSLPGGLDGSNISATTYLLTFAWVKRFKQRMGRVERGQPIRGVEAKGIILTSPQEAVEAAGEGVGSLVKVVPVDTGRNHPQIGVLLRRDKERIVLDVLPTTETERTLRVVFPVRGYEIKDAMTGSKL